MKKDMRDKRMLEMKDPGWMLLETDEDTGLSANLENLITPLSGMLYDQRCTGCSLLFKQVIEYGMGLVIRFVDYSEYITCLM